MYTCNSVVAWRYRYEEEESRYQRKVCSSVPFYFYTFHFMDRFPNFLHLSPNIPIPNNGTLKKRWDRRDSEGYSAHLGGLYLGMRKCRVDCICSYIHIVRVEEMCA